MSGIAILKREGLEFKDSLGDSLGLYATNAVKFNNLNVFDFDDERLHFEKKVTSSTIAPVAANELVTKGYVDGVAVGLNVIKSCDVATFANINLDTELKSGLPLNGVDLVDGMRVLVWKQTELKTNGIYVINGQTIAARSSDFDETSEIKGGVHTFVTGGTNYVNSGFVVTTPDNNLMEVSVSDIVWTQFSKSGVHTFIDDDGGLLTASDGITVSVNNYIARTAALDTEVARAEAAETANAAAITAEASTARTAETANAAAITAEASTARAAETANATAITAEASTARAAEEANAAAITAEASTARTAETALTAKLDPSLLNNNAMVFSNSDGSALTSYSGFYHNNSGITVPNVTTTSDETKKRDIKELSDSELIYKLRPVEYKWKDENMDQRTKYGFIAQEVLEIFPSMVTKQNGVYGIEYINLISHLVKEVQILREEVNSMNRSV